ncbi:HIT family protein [Macrococcoides canis]|uniref:HIT family protein n=1 Tax=Macrococcoides canis TaxID=1855823 RepID=UPI00165E3337|nr:HIT domain-containing protein [Macrococcus canis]QNR07899.1 HIT domain-containing protein [Macrococcus canis]
MERDCFICEKHQDDSKIVGAKIFENDLFYIGHIHIEGNEHYLGHIMIDLKRHVPTLADLTIDEAKEYGRLSVLVSKALKESECAEHIYALVSGNSVPHFHLHLIARYPNTPEEFLGPMDVRKAPNARKGSESEVEQLCQRIKLYMEHNAYE